MLSYNYPRAYDKTGEHAACRPTGIDSQGVKVTGGVITRLDESPIGLWATTMLECGCMPASAAEARKVAGRLVSDGYNALRMVSPFVNRKWTSGSGADWGPWLYDSGDAQWSTVSNRWLLSEPAMVMLDTFVAELFAAGIECILFSNNNYDEFITRHSSNHAQGTYRGGGLQWSAEYRTIIQEGWDRVRLRTNTVTGTRYIDDKRFVWQMDNENGFSDHMSRSTRNGWNGNTKTGNNTLGSAVITGLASTADLLPDMRCQGTGIDTNSTILITSVDSASQITISAVTSAGTVGGTYTFTCHWFDKIVGNITDTGGNNGYWYTELNTKLMAWAASAECIAINGGAWTVPAWGFGCNPYTRAGGSQGFPRYATLTNWNVARDIDLLISFIDAMEVEYQCAMLDWLRSEHVGDASPPCWVPCTFHYMTPRASLGLPVAYRVNIIVDRHAYAQDGLGPVGVKDTGTLTRRSLFDSTTGWAPGTDGAFWVQHNGTRSKTVAYWNNEIGQYGPNRWRYQLAYFEMFTGLLNEFALCDFAQGQKQSTGQLNTDGRYMSGDAVNCASPAWRLASRAVAPAIKYGFLSRHANEYSFNTTLASYRTYQWDRNTPRINPGGYVLLGGTPYLTYQGQGFGFSIWDRRIYWEWDEGTAATTEASIQSNYPQVSLATRRAGLFVKDTATEKLYIRTPEGPTDAGAEVATPYMCGYIDTITATSRINATYAGFNPMVISAMGATVDCGVCFLRSDGLWPLFTGPMKLFIHGSDYDTGLVTQSGGAGEAAFMASDLQTVNYSGSAQVWHTTGTAASVRLMAPEGFTITLDTTLGGTQAKTDLELFGVTAAGLPVRLTSSYNTATGAWTYVHDPVARPYPEFTLQPKVSGAGRARELLR